MDHRRSVNGRRDCRIRERSSLCVFACRSDGNSSHHARPLHRKRTHTRPANPIGCRTHDDRVRGNTCRTAPPRHLTAWDHRSGNHNISRKRLPNTCRKSDRRRHPARTRPRKDKRYRSHLRTHRSPDSEHNRNTADLDTATHQHPNLVAIISGRAHPLPQTYGPDTINIPLLRKPYVDQQVMTILMPLPYRKNTLRKTEKILQHSTMHMPKTWH